MASYQPWVVADYVNSQSKQMLTIDDYVDSVVRHLPSVETDEIYEPVEVHVQLSGLQSVPLQLDFDSSWHRRLLEGVKNMISASCAGAGLGKISLKTVTGQPIESAVRTAEDLANVGRIKVFENGKRVDLPKLPEPPVELRNDSLMHLDKWFEQKIKNQAATIITDELKGTRNEYELQEKTSSNSSLDKKLRQLVEGSASKNFLEVYGSTQRAKQTPVAHVAESISSTLLRQTREILAGSEKRLVRHLNAKLAAELKQKNEPHIFASVEKMAGNIENEQKLYGNMAQKALRFAKMNVIDSVYRAQPLSCDCSTNKGPATSKKSGGGGTTGGKANEEEEEIPKEKEETGEAGYGRDRYYDDYYYGQEVYDKVQLYCGKAVFMECSCAESSPAPTPVKSQIAASTERLKSSTGSPLRGARLREELQKRQEMPGLISKPILTTAVAADRNTILIPGNFGSVPVEAPLNIRQKPKLIPINQALIGNRGDDEEEEDEVPVRRVKDAWGKVGDDINTILIPGNFGSEPADSKISAKINQVLIGNHDDNDDHEEVPVRRVKDAWGKASDDNINAILIPGNFGSAPVEAPMNTRQKPKLVPIGSKAQVEPVRINDGMKDIYYYAEKRKQENLKAKQKK